jgi:hypothetical protein
MPADLSMRGGQDRRRIDVSQEHELQDWSEKFGVKRERLREAVKAVGDRADAVKEHLSGGKSSGDGERGGGSKGQGRGSSGI